MLRELFNDYEWSILKTQSEELCKKAEALPDKINLYNIQPVPQSDAEKYNSQQKTTDNY